jgi:hypothetical protein
MAPELVYWLRQRNRAGPCTVRPSFAVSCMLWANVARLDLGSYPDGALVLAFGPRMVCTSCGIIGADAPQN